MLNDVKTLPDDPALLKGLIASLTLELTAKDAELTSRDVLIAKLQHQLSGLRRHQFGARSEAIDQLELTLEEHEIARAAEAPAIPPEGEKQQPKRHPLPESLPRHETTLSPGETCADCGGKLRAFDQDVTEELEYIPAGLS